MANPRIRESLDGSESNFSLIDHAFADDSALSDGGLGSNAQDASATPGQTSAAIRAYYPISTIMSNPRAASAAQTISTNLSNLNPLRATTGPKTGATRGKAATPIVLSDLPKVSSKSYDAYIGSIKEDFTAWSKVQSALADAPVLDELDDDDTLLDEEASKRRKAIKRALETSNISIKASTKVELPSLESIPPIFFEENFNLANPRTFDVVTSGDTAAKSETTSTRPNTDFATDQILQEKLSHWLDMVELHLNVEISLRSASFFSALSNLKELDSQSAEAVKQIGELKNVLDAVDEKVARKGLTAVRQGVRRRRLHGLDVALERIKEILRAVDQAEELGEAGETEGALDLADEIEREWESSLSSINLQTPPTPAVEKPLHEAMTIISEEGENQESEACVQTAKPPITPLTALRPRGDHHAPVRIAQIKCMSNLPTRLSMLRSGIAQTLEHELVAVLLHALREGRETLVSSTEQWRAAPGTQVTIYETLRDSASTRVRACLSGLVRCGKHALDDAISAWREAMLKEVRKTVREVLPTASTQDDDDTPADHTPSSRSSFEGGRSSLDGRCAYTHQATVRSLDHTYTSVYQSSARSGDIQSLNQEDYLRVMRELHTSMLAILVLADLQARAISSSVSDLLEARSTSIQRSSRDGSVSSGQALNEAWISALQSELTDGVQAVAELVNVRLARIVAGRGDLHSHLSLFDFWTAFSESWQFVLDCEVVCRKMIVGLRGVIVGQAKAFLQEFHQKTFLEVAQAVEQEQWSPADVPAAVQASVDKILQSAVETPSSWDFKRDQPVDDSSRKAPAKQLGIEDKSYFAVSATLQCLQAMESYLKVVINLPLLSTDVMSRIIEFLKQFNSRVCQMVLGAGAMRSAGLKNITAKHLAMASQSISILINIIPYTRECLRRHLRAKQAVILVDFDKLKRDCQEHQNEIHAKLVAIMGDRLHVHCKALQEIDWEAAAPSEGKVNAYMETLVKETGTLHKVLLKYLAGSALEIVMMQVLSAINSRLAEEFSKIPLKSQTAKDRMLVDATFLKEKFADLKGLERAPPGAELVNLVQDKMIEQPKPASQPKGRQFSTPSLTRPRSDVRSHSRTASNVSLAQADAPLVTAVAITEPALPAREPVDIETSSAAGNENDLKDTEAATTASEPAADVIPVQDNMQAENTPLPKSPESEVPPMIAEVLIEKKDSNDTRKEEVAPSTPTKDEGVFSPPVPEKQPDVHGTPTGNVKNRLAGLFAKRPAMPTIAVPAIPNLLPKAVPIKGLHTTSPASHDSAASKPGVGDRSEEAVSAEHPEARFPADSSPLPSTSLAFTSKPSSAIETGPPSTEPPTHTAGQSTSEDAGQKAYGIEEAIKERTPEIEAPLSPSIRSPGESLGEDAGQKANVDTELNEGAVQDETMPSLGSTEVAEGSAEDMDGGHAQAEGESRASPPKEAASIDHIDDQSHSLLETSDKAAEANQVASPQSVDDDAAADTSGSTESTFESESDKHSAQEPDVSNELNDLDDID